MKKYLILLFILPMLLIACTEEGGFPAMPPYIFFDYDTNTYVIDPDDYSLCDNPALKEDSIIGRIYAQNMFSSFRYGDVEQGQDELGDSLTRVFTCAVSLADKTADFDVPFTLTDRTGNTVTVPFHYRMARPITSYEVTMGAQYNPYVGFFFSFADQKVYSVNEMMALPDPVGFCFGYNINKREPQFVSPSELINQTILPDYKGSNICSFVSVPAIKGRAITEGEFAKMKNDALMMNLNPIEWGTYTTATVNANMAYMFKNEEDTFRGMIFVKSLESGVGGQVQLIIKMQEANPY